MVRISTAQIHNQSINSILQQQSKLSRVSMQISSGMRILAPSDDPSGAVQRLELNQAIDTLQQYKKNGFLAEGRLELEEATLKQVEDVLMRSRELAVQGNNATLSREDRGFLAEELRQRLDELQGLANTRDANGEYIFAGFHSQTEPFAPGPGGVYGYAGDSGQRLLQISANRQLAIGDPGSQVFMEIPDGNGTFSTLDNPANTGTGIIDPGSVSDPSLWAPDTYTINFLAPDSYEVTRLSDGAVLIPASNHTSGELIQFAGIQTSISGTPATGDSFTVQSSVSQDMFTSLQNMITALEMPRSNDADRAASNNAFNRVMVDLDQAMEKTLDIRAGSGARLQTLDSQAEINEDSVVSLRETLSSIEDLDYAEAIGEMELQLVGLQAAQQSFLKIKGLSLFNFLR